MAWITAVLACILATSVLCDQVVDDGDLSYAENGNEFEGDIVLDNDFRNIIQYDSQRWPNGVVPYNIGGEYSSSDRSKIIAALNVISSKTCIKFKQRSNERGYVQINSRSGCSSPVGYNGYTRNMSLRQGGCMSQATIIHEFLHALGIWHEQSRPDRDQYVDIFLQNVPTGNRHNFNKKSSSRTLGFPYDYGSVMHYGKYAFSNNRKPTILPKDRSKTIGQRRGLSTTDIAKLNKLYQCNGSTGGSLTTGGTGTGSNCSDGNTNCNYWTGKGYCTSSTYKNYMAKNCRKACKYC